MTAKPPRMLVNQIADPIVAKVAEKPRFGAPFNRQGPLIANVGALVFRAGGCPG